MYYFCPVPSEASISLPPTDSHSIFLVKLAKQKKKKKKKKNTTTTTWNREFHL